MVTWPVVPQLKPFRALRYDPGTVGPLDAVVSPPHDVITPERREALITASPYNAVRLLNPDSPEDAAALLQAWQADGVLVREAEPAVWVLEETFPGLDGGTRTRLGIVARVELSPYSAGQVLPHERTFERQKDARLELFRATRTKLSPVFLVHDGPPPTIPSGGLEMEATLDGVTSRLWRVTGEDAIEAMLAAVRGRLLIADGHHRYETAVTYRDERRAAGKVSQDESYEYMMMTFVAMESDGLVILPTHRVLSELPAFQPALFFEQLKAQFELQEVATLDKGLAALREIPPPQSAFLVVTRRTLLLATALPQVAEALAHLSPCQRELDVVVLHELVLGRLLGLSATDIRELKHIEYLRDAREAVDRVRAGADVAFLMNPARIEQVRDVAFAGEVMPQKSTDFYPKLLSGLTMYALD